MNEQAKALFSTFDVGINSYARHTASLVRKIVQTQELSPEQHQALEATLRSQFESFTWFLLGCFDNVGCSLPEGVLGFSILANPSDPAKPDEHEPLAPVDIREGEEDYTDMWQDYLASSRLASRTPAV